MQQSAVARADAMLPVRQIPTEEVTRSRHFPVGASLSTRRVRLGASRSQPTPVLYSGGVSSGQGVEEGAGGLTAADRLRLDYQQTTDLLRTLGDVRFKLLALVPTLSGAAIALLAHPSSAVEILALGVLGLVATLGILAYDLRNSQLSDYALRRARSLESALGLGVYKDEPTNALRLFGVATVNRDRGLSLVYSAALAGWCYLVAWGSLRAADVGHSRPIGAAIGAVIGVVVLAEFTRIGSADR
jgi:hypothetical protein